VVGSDPYLAPEVFLQKQYDAEKVDIWSLAIIFCCMTLRRFPWKCPKSTDNSYKLFVTQPTEEELQSPIYPTVRSNAQSEPTSRHPSGPQSSSSQQSAQSEPAPSKQDASAQDNASSKAPSDAQSIATTVTPTATSTAQIIKGPWRLLRLLPRETRHIIGSMLDLDPVKRVNLETVMDDPWVQKSVYCRQEIGGQVIHTEGHVHTLSGGSDGETHQPH
jgi:serine/threonine protein kinase